MNRVLISIGNFNIYWYSVLIIIAIFLGIAISTKEAEKSKVGKSFIIDLIFYLIPVGIIGARIYYVIFNYSSYKDNLIDIFKIWNGGLAIYGAILAAIIFIIYYCKKHEKNILETLDIFSVPLILGQAIGRWGNFINQEAYGSVTSLDFLHKLHLPNFIIEGMYINGNYYQPTFLYESLFCLLGFIILLIIRKKTRNQKYHGSVVFSYFIYYGIGRFLIEGLRLDSLYLGNIRISQLVSIILVLIGIIGLIIITIKNKKTFYEEATNVKL